MKPITVRLGFVPSYRWSYTDWVDQMRGESLAAFAQIPGVEIVCPQPAPDGKTVDPLLGSTAHGCVNTLDEAEAVAAYFRREGVDGLILSPLDFGDERSAVKVAEQMSLPVLLFATKEPPANNDAMLSRVSDSYCGNLSMAAGLHRRKIPFYYAGLFFPNEPELRAAVMDFAGAVAVVKGLRNARIGQVGVRPSAFETVAFDEIAMARKFGQNVIPAELSDLVDQAQRIAEDDPRVLAAVAKARAEAATITVAEDYLLNSARLEVALTDFWQRNRLSAMAIQCWPAIGKLMKISLCALYGRMTDAAMLTACETDVLGAVSMLVSYQSALGASAPHFIDWTIQHRDHPNRLLAWHCGNGPTSLAADPGKVALRSRTNMSGELPVEADDAMAGLVQFQVKPGRVTLCRLVEYDGQWKMLIAGGEIIPSNETLGGTWSWVEVSDHARLYRTLVEEGFIHHASMIHGDQRAALLQACKFLDIQPVWVD